MNDGAIQAPKNEKKSRAIRAAKNLHAKADTPPESNAAGGAHAVPRAPEAEPAYATVVPRPVAVAQAISAAHTAASPASKENEDGEEPDTASHWIRIGKALGCADDGPVFVGGNAQAVPDGLQIDAGIPFNIAPDTLNSATSLLSLSSSVADKIAGIVDLVRSAENGNQFANNLEQVFGDLGILQAGWRPKAQQAFDGGNEQDTGPGSQT